LTLLAALSALPSAYILTALTRRDWERWLTEGKMLCLIAFGAANSLGIVYLFERTH
jgi:hypothetical protein